MVLQVSNPNNVKIYTVSGGIGSRSIPDWLARRKRRALKNDIDWRSRVELIQDFEFPEASNRIKTTRDGKFVVATGVYKPQMRVYEYAEMSMKFDRHTDAENVNFEILSDDWTKQVLLQNDRSIEFHAQGGIHYRTRIPKFGRDLSYHFSTCDLLVVGAGPEVYRLNLDQGRFLNPLITDSASGINVSEINPAHQLFGFGTVQGTVEFWDPRSRARVGVLVPQVNTFGGASTAEMEVTALKYRTDGLSLAVGTSTGHTLLYDLRSSRPWLVKDHQYGFEIRSLNWHDGGGQGVDEGGKVIVADKKIIKIWDRNNGEHFTSIEPATDINDVCLVESSGVLFVANEGIQIGSYYIPQLGPAPQWCTFLDNLTEEMEENPQQNVYDDYKFVTRKELAALGLEHLIGSNVLKAYMHGFFVDLRLYEKAKLIANPFAYDEYRERVIRDKIEKERGSRIRATNKLPKVNKALARQLLEEEEKKRRKGKLEEGAANPLNDSRFSGMFMDKDFEVDEETVEFKLLHPTAKKRAIAFDEEADEDEEGEDEQTVSGSDSDRLTDSDSDDDLVAKIRKSRGDKGKKKAKAPQGIRSAPDERWKMKEKTKGYNKEEENTKKGPKMVEMKVCWSFCPDITLCGILKFQLTLIIVTSLPPGRWLHDAAYLVQDRAKIVRRACLDRTRWLLSAGPARFTDSHGWDGAIVPGAAEKERLGEGEGGEW
ncbi:WD40-repeat-containing domain protein [Jimgerdemannia flammicorona]|uniref:WD40-repeat-containing domain protein n=1 Tax=Jimgerdemannia flammicorona TaxID=994334 RepID=A0A433QT36_9FUNG|nr:WD40-repeat-containing domain protein [Jimgerdemannia flammicorona]